MFSTIFLQASPLEGMLPMLIMVGAMFLLFLWPQMRKQKKEKQFQENINLINDMRRMILYRYCK